MSRRLNIVVSCTNRKAAAAGEPVRLRDVRASATRPLIDEWWDALRSARAAPLPAESLYVGEQWSIVRRLGGLAEKRGWRPKLWICSAGFGLTERDTPVVPYSATFSPGEEDSVIDQSDSRGARAQVSEWWKSLARKRGGRRLATALDDDGDTVTVVAVSWRYLCAIDQDLVEYSRRLDDERLLLVCGGRNPQEEALSKWVLPCESKLRVRLGGTLTGLNVRVVEWLLGGTGELSRSSARARLARLLRETPAPKPLHREKVSDAEVKSFIRRNLDVAASASRSLRLLRDSGLACEQSRFAELFHSVASDSVPSRRRLAEEGAVR